MVLTGKQVKHGADGRSKAIVLDCGSATTRAGHAGEGQPKVKIPSVVGYPKSQSPGATVGATSRGCYVGDDVLQHRHEIKLTHPIEYGILSDWKGMERMWEHIFTQLLKIDPSQHPVLVTEVPQNPPSCHEKVAEILFETFHVPAIYIAVNVEMALLASARATGCVVDVGDTAIYFMPFVRGVPQQGYRQRIDVGGRGVTGYLQKLLQQKEIQSKIVQDRFLAQVLKENLCYVALDPAAEAKKDPKTLQKSFTYEGETITIDIERYLAAEYLFDPFHMGEGIFSLGAEIVNSIKNCPAETQAELLANIILAGGASLMPGYAERLAKEIQTEVGDAVDMQLVSLQDRDLLSWRGGSILAQRLNTSQTGERAWITREEYHHQVKRIF